MNDQTNVTKIKSEQKAVSCSYPGRRVYPEHFCSPAVFFFSQKSNHRSCSSSLRRNPESLFPPTSSHHTPSLTFCLFVYALGFLGNGGGEALEYCDSAFVVPGNTTKTLWNSTYDTEELPQIIQPKSGYFYNANHSPFKSTDEKENPNRIKLSSVDSKIVFSLTAHIIENDNNTSLLQ